jgi:hypothetical protein
MSKCLTKPLLPQFSGCLVADPKCIFAVRFGFSFYCEHTQHEEFKMNTPDSVNQSDHNEIYRELRDSRRREYIGGFKFQAQKVQHDAV